MKIGIILVLFHTPKNEQKRLIDEISHLNISDYHIYSIDNTTNNRGFAAAVNIGLTQALHENCDMVIIANPDISLKFFPTGIAFREIIKKNLEHFDVWGYAMKQADTVYYGGEIDAWRMSGGLLRKKPASMYSDCDFVSGSFLCIKREVLETIGFLDERFFMYYEDVEYCARAKRAGYKVGIDSSITYEHYENSKENLQKSVYLARNRLLFMLRYGTVSQKIYEVVRIPLTIYEERRTIKYAVTNDKFFLNFISLNVSSFVNKILFFILFIYLFRYLGIANYGVYTLVWAHTAILSPLLDLGTTSYGIIYSPTEPIEKIKSLISLRISISLVVFVLTILLAYLFHYQLNVIYFILLTSVIIFSNALSGSLLIISSLLNKAYMVSLISFIFNLILVVIQISILVSLHSIQAIFISIFALYGLYTLANAYFIKRWVPTISFFYFDIPKWKKIISKSYVFVLIGLFAGVYYKVDLFLLNMMKGQTDVGIYSAGYKFLDALMFIPASYNMTSTPIFARIHKNTPDLLKNRIKKDIMLLLPIGLSVSLAMFFIAPIILPLILHTQISPSIPVLKIVIFALPLMLLSSVFFNTLYVLHKPKIVILLFAFQSILNGTLNYFLIPKYSYIGSAYITVISEVVNLLILVALVSVYLKPKKNENIH